MHGDLAEPAEDCYAMCVERLATPGLGTHSRWTGGGQEAALHRAAAAAPPQHIPSFQVPSKGFVLKWRPGARAASRIHSASGHASEEALAGAPALV